MRVTNSMISNNFLRDMNTNMENLSTLQGQMTTGKEIRKPSDNPFKVARAMQLHSDINTNKQYGENISDTTNWMSTTDTALGQSGDVLQRIRELLVSTGDPGYGADEQAAIKNEINQKIGEMSQILNTNYDGRYVFGGTKSNSKPVMEQVTAGNTNIAFADNTGTLAATPAELAMIGSKLSVEVSQGVTMQYNINAADVINNGGGAATSLTTVFSNITTHLDAGATSILIGQDLKDITDAMTNVLKLRSEVGAKTNRMESAKSKNESDNFNMTEILSKTEDIDITQKTMEYATMQTVYTASLQTSAKILQPTLMDYLR